MKCEFNESFMHSVRAQQLARILSSKVGEKTPSCSRLSRVEIRTGSEKIGGGGDGVGGWWWFEDAEDFWVSSR